MAKPAQVEVVPANYDDKIIFCFKALCAKNGNGASPVEVTEEMANLGWLSSMDSVLDIADIMARLRHVEGRL